MQLQVSGWASSGYCWSNVLFMRNSISKIISWVDTENKGLWTLTWTFYDMDSLRWLMYFAGGRSGIRMTWWQRIHLILLNSIMLTSSLAIFGKLSFDVKSNCSNSSWFNCTYLDYKIILLDNLLHHPFQSLLIVTKLLFKDELCAFVPKYVLYWYSLGAEPQEAAIKREC